MEILPSRIIYRFAVPGEMFTVCQGGKRTAPIVLPVGLHIKSEVTALPFQVHTVDSWALQTCVRIKAKLFMMDDITDSNTVMG